MWNGQTIMLAGSDKKQYPGDAVFPAGEYDFVFDVEWTDKKALLPYNKDQNPMQVSEAFCAREGIGKANIDQIRKFIEANAGAGNTIGPASTQAAAPKPSGYSPPAPTAKSMFPLTTPLQFKDGK